MGNDEKRLSVQEAFGQAWAQFEAGLASLQAQGADQEALSVLWQSGQAIAGLAETLAQQSRAAKAKAKSLGAALEQEQKQRAALVKEMEDLRELAKAVENQDFTYGPLEALYETVAEMERESFWEYEIEQEAEIEVRIRAAYEDEGRADEIRQEYAEEELKDDLAAQLAVLGDRLGVELPYYQAQQLVELLLGRRLEFGQKPLPQDELLKALLEALVEEADDESD